MSNNNIIHETVIRDIIDLLNTTKEMGIEFSKDSRNNSKYMKSISHASDSMTLVFPVLVSSSISIETASMVSKAVERKAATMLQMLFSALNVNDSESGLDYLRRFHTNLKIDDGMTLDSYIDFMNNLPLESTINPIEYRKQVRAVVEDMKHHTNYVVAENFNPVSINEYRLVNKFGKNTIIHKSPKVQTSIYEYDEALDDRRSKNVTDISRNQLLPSDVKKANEVVPTMMVVNFVTSTDQGKCVTQSSMVIGVKSKIYPIPSNNMMERIYSKNQDRNGFLKFIRSTTREISFVKDFLLAIDKAKVDALSSARRGSSSKIWKVLERRSTKSKIRRALMQQNDASAISTMVISQEEVEYMKRNYNIHVDQSAVIRPIMEAYNLMCVVILDEINEVAKFIYDTGNDEYELYSFRSLEKESSDNDFKKMINLMTKTR